MSAPITHGPTGLINWKARALAAESKLARLEGLERAAREYEIRQRQLSTAGASGTNLRAYHEAKMEAKAATGALHQAARAYASENGE